MGSGKWTPFGPGETADDVVGGETEETTRSNMQYRRQRRGGKGLRDIRTTDRNGKVVDVLAVAEDDHLLMITAGGKIQRIRVSDISQIGRNTQGVRVIRLKDDDQLVSCARIPGEILIEDETPPTQPEAPPENTDADAPETE
jgi:DNA gyrase subunit A